MFNKNAISDLARPLACSMAHRLAPVIHRALLDKDRVLSVVCDPEWEYQLSGCPQYQ